MSPTMRRPIDLWLLIATGAALVGMVSSPASAQEASVQTDQETLEAVADYVDEQRVEHGVPGLALAIVVGDEVRLAMGLGEASTGRPVTPDTAFLINSLSKSVTAMALMQLADEGLVALDDPIGEHLPELSSQGGDAVTVRDVMHHRSGLSDPPDRARSGIGEDDLEAGLGLATGLRTGAPYEYANLNYDLLALVVERAGGEPFADQVESRIFAPLAMSRSAVGTDRAGDLEPADGHYHWLFAGYRPFDTPVDHAQLGAAAMYSTASDLAAYLTVHLNEGVYRGERIVSTEALAILHEARLFEEGASAGYGGGLTVEPADTSPGPAALAPYKTVWHGGASEAYRSVMWMTLGPDVGMVMLANGSDPAHQSWISQVGFGTRLIVSGEEPIDAANGEDPLIRWSKHIYLAVALAQIALLVLALPVLGRLRRNRTAAAGGWWVLGVATVVDVVAAVGVFVLTPAVSGESLLQVLELPDYRILITAILIGVGWGAVRILLTGWWLWRPRPAPSGVAGQVG